MLLHRLLHQIDRHPPGTVDAVDLAEADPALVERLIADQILIQDVPLRTIEADPTSQDQLRRPVRSIEGEPFAFSIEGGAAPERIDPLELIHYRINLMSLCRAIQTANSLIAPGPEMLSHRTVLVGHQEYGAGRRPVVLCRLLTNKNAIETIHMLLGRLKAERIILLTPTERALSIDLLYSLGTSTIQLVAATTALAGSRAQPFALQLSKATRSGGVGTDPSVDLRIDIQGQRAFLFGHEVDLTEREFKVLVELGKAYEGGGYVSRDRLYQIIYLRLRKDEDPYEEQVTYTISCLRQRLAAIIQPSSDLAFSGRA